MCWVLSMDSLSYGRLPAVPRSQHLWLLFAFPPLLVGAELGHECGSCSFFVRAGKLVGIT
jgi:hypothetical protein